MKKQIKLIFVLLTLVFSTLGFANRKLIPRVNATYVEGLITQDTDWTLVDSPFVLSNNVTINSGATLTIEPGAEVRFGGDFSLIVNGRIVANGTKDKMIRFTTNDPTHNTTWRTIELNGPQASFFINCVVEYGTNGTTVENGRMEIQDSFVESNSGNGIVLNSGSASIRNCEITNNNLTGILIANGTQITIDNNILSSNGEAIRISGGTQVTAKNNAVTSNDDGIILMDHLIGSIDIEQNNITLSKQSGVILESDSYGNITIIKNRIYANSNGFLVSTNTSTYITRNYISNNTIGINYESGNDHKAHFNDIYDNKMGMAVSTMATVNATYDYWGHKSGPFHVSLNPYGKGNPVGGDGLSIDFTFFLSAPIDHSNTAPTPVLWTDKFLVAPGQNVTFVGADSYDDGRVDQYFFDFGDGINTGWITSTLFNHTYSIPRMYNASLRVTDDFNVSSESVATVTVTVEDGITPLNVAISLGGKTVNYNGEVSVIAYVSNETGAVEGANVALLSVKGGSFNPISGVTNSTGYFTATFIAPDTAEITDIRIIARAFMEGYADGSDHEYLEVLPPLQVQVSSEPQTIKSEDTSDITVLVTLGSEKPVSEALVILNTDSGNVSAITGATDSNGTATFVFTAPQTLSHITVNITATAVKTEYAGGQGQTTVDVEPRLLAVGVSADPPIIVSQAASTVMVRVTSVTAPMSDATVAISSDLGGSFSPTIGTTDLNGNVSFVFTAPLVTNVDGSIATVNIAVSKTGYVNGEGQIGITVVPRLLVVQVSTESTVTTSEERINATIHVAYAYDMSPVAAANVTISLTDGENLTKTGSTDLSGDVKLSFTAPPVNATTVYTLSAIASKIGYVNGQNTSTITVNPGVINVQIRPSSQAIESGGTAVIDVYVANNANASIANVSVTMATNYGNFTTATKLTDSKGVCSFIFNAPETPAQLPVKITANATRNGYVDGGNQTMMSVIPRMSSEVGGGLALTTLLLIIIPIVIVVIVVVLIKLKVISISMKEET
jgi:hypothetical protein